MQIGLSRNMVMSGLQSAIAIAVLFLSYRMVLQALGPETLGLWSLLMSLTLAVRVFDPTGGATVGRFVAIARKTGPNDDAPGPEAEQYIDTAIFLLLGLYIALAAVAYFPLTWLLASQIDDPENLAVAMNVLPLLLGLMVASVTAMSNSDAVDGIGRADLRAIIMMIGYGIQLALTWLWLPKFGLAGFAMAQICQFIAIGILSRLVLRHHIGNLGWFPRSASRAVAQQMVGYGAKLQISALAMLMADPLLRLLINHFSGLSLLGLYELASKLVVQLRSLLVSSMMPLIPRFAGDRGAMSADDHALFRRMVKLVAISAAAIAVASVAASPVLSWVMLGRIDRDVMTITAILALGYFGNTVSLIHYLQAQANGRLFWNILGTFAIGMATIIVGPLLVPIIGPIAVIIGFASGLALAGFIFIAGNARHH